MRKGYEYNILIILLVLRSNFFGWDEDIFLFINGGTENFNNYRNEKLVAKFNCNC